MDLNNVNTSLCEEGQTTGWQWNARDVGFNLNADVALVKVCLLINIYYSHFPRTFKLTLKESRPASSRLAPSLPQQGLTRTKNSQTISNNFSIAEELAQSNDQFVEEFSAVYTKLLSTGYEGLLSVE